MLDFFLEWTVVLLPVCLSIGGVLVSLKAPHSKHHTAWRLGLITVGILLSVVTGWQQSRSRSAHAIEVNGLNSELTSLQHEVNVVRKNQQTETARREQAEKALAIMVQTTGKATRDGVVSDIKQSPIRVEVNREQSQVKRRIRDSLGEFLRQALVLQNELRDETKSFPEEKAKCEALVKKIQQFIIHESLGEGYQARLLSPAGLPPMSYPFIKDPNRRAVWLGMNVINARLAEFLSELKD